MSGGSGLRLSVLGELCATIDGVPLDLGGRRQRAVLAVLVVARGEVVPADRLADAVWGDDAPANTPGALQSYVSHLRKRLEPGAGARLRGAVLVREGTGYAVRLPPDAVDAWEVESLVQASVGAPPAQAAELLTRALSMWHGPAYVEYADEPWAEPEAARLAGLRTAARERLFDARLACGQPDLLVPELEAFVAEDPLQEERWRLLVLALYRAQRQADALAALRRARGVLAEELGCDPGPALRALEAQVLAQEPSLHLVPARPATQPSLQPATPGVPEQRVAALPAADLVDRERELHVLRRALEAVTRGEPGLVLVEGPAGIGKTRLMVEACREAERRGLTVLTARGTPLERAFGFGAARQLLEPVLRTDTNRDRLLAGAAASARGVFDEVDADAGSFSVLHGLYWLTVNLTSDGPVVLAVDDLQWCDSPSLRYLAYLVKRLEELPVLVVATLRTGEQHEEEDLLCELILDPLAVPVRPGPLGLAATTALVRERLGEPAPEFAGACHHTTSGNPLLLRQLLRALEAEQTPPDVLHIDLVRAIGSRAVSSLVLLRLRRMPAHVVAAARAVAVLGAAARLPTVAALAELDEPTAAAALAALSRTEVLRDEQPLTFVHPLVRDAIYGEMPVAERALRHERAGQVLLAAGAPAEQVAAHLLLAPQRGNAATVAVLQAAARTAVDRGAAETAVTLLRRALDEPALGQDRLDVLLELGLVETLVDGPAAVGHLREAWPFLDDPGLRGEIGIVIARTHVFASERGIATAFAREARASLPPDHDDARQGLLALQWVTGLMHALDPATYRDGEPEVRGTGPGARMLAAVIGQQLVFEGRDRKRAVELSRFALEGDQLLKIDNGLLWVTATHSLAIADEDVGDFWDRADRLAHAQGSLFTALSVSLWRGYREWLRGDLVDAVQSLRDALEQIRMWGSSAVGASFSQAFLVQALLDRGEPGEARAVLEEARKLEPVGEGGRLLQAAEGRLLLEEGRPGDALAALDRVVDVYGLRNPAWVTERSTRAAALQALGRTEEARALLEDDVVRLREWGAPAFLGAGLRKLGELTGDLDVLREAEQLLASSSAAVERARARAALGRRLPGPEGTALLQAARAEALATGAAGLRHEVETELTGRGAPPPAHDAAPPLSRTQQRAMDLVRRGLDLREVAQELFLTPGSVRATLATATSGAR